MTILWIILALFVGMIIGIMIETSVTEDNLKKDGYILIRDNSKAPGKGRYSIIKIDLTKKL